MGKRRKISASVIIRADSAWVDPDDARQRLDERDARIRWDHVQAAG